MWNGARYGVWSRADPDLTRRFLEDRGPFYLIARALSVAYAVASLPLVFAIGRAAFDPWVGLAATWIAFLSPLALSHAQIARTDSAGMFFTSLSVWLCLRLRERPSIGRSIAAGAAIGLGVASRYFLVTLTPVLLAAQAAGFRRSWRTAWPVVAGGLLAIPVAFVAASPFFLLDLATVQRDLRSQNMTTHLGADGLSFAGNLAYSCARASRRCSRPRSRCSPARARSSRCAGAIPRPGCSSSRSRRTSSASPSRRCTGRAG